MISEEKKGNRIPTNEFCCISIVLISLLFSLSVNFFCSIQFYPEWIRYERQHERHCAYRLESRQRTRFLNFSRTILPNKNISFTNGQPLKIRFPKWTGPVWCVSRWIKALRWSWLFAFFFIFAKKIDHKKDFLDYFNPNSYPSDADKKVRKYQYQKTYMQYIYHPWY